MGPNVYQIRQRPTDTAAIVLHLSLVSIFSQTFLSLKTFSVVFLNIYVYSRKLNAEFNKLIKSVGHCARFFEK